MDEEVHHSIHNAMEILDQELLPTDSKTDQRIQNLVDYQSDKATDAPMNHGDGIGMLQVIPGPSSKAKGPVKRSRKRTDILVILRESLHRESKSIAKEKIRNAIKDRRMQYNPIIKKSRKRLRGRAYRKRYTHKKSEKAKKKSLQEKKRNKMIQQRVLRLSPICSNTGSSVSDSQGSKKSLSYSSESGSSHSRTS